MELYFSGQSQDTLLKTCLKCISEFMMFPIFAFLWILISIEVISFKQNFNILSENIQNMVRNLRKYYKKTRKVLLVISCWFLIWIHYIIYYVFLESPWKISLKYIRLQKHWHALLRYDFKILTVVDKDDIKERSIWRLDKNAKINVIVECRCSFKIMLFIFLL